MRSTGSCSSSALLCRTMGRSKEAPYGFECPYRNACPHLGGMSTRWANSLVADAHHGAFGHSHYVALITEENAALEADNQRLEKENAELRARLQAEHASRFKPNRQPIRDPKQRRKRGAPKGHPPWNRRFPIASTGQFECPPRASVRIAPPPACSLPGKFTNRFKKTSSSNPKPSSPPTSMKPLCARTAGARSFDRRG